jgi:hypothetical protein
MADTEIWDALEGVPLTKDLAWDAATAALSPVREAIDGSVDLSGDSLSRAAYRLYLRLSLEEKARARVPVD